MWRCGSTAAPVGGSTTSGLRHSVEVLATPAATVKPVGCDSSRGAKGGRDASILDVTVTEALLESELAVAGAAVLRAGKEVLREGCANMWGCSTQRPTTVVVRKLGQGEQVETMTKAEQDVVDGW